MTTVQPSGDGPAAVHAAGRDRDVILPRALLVVLTAAALTVTLAGLRETAGIVGPAVLALVLTITVHPVRRAMLPRRLPEWLVSLTVTIAV